MGSVRRLLHPALNPTGLTAAAGAVFAAAVMIYNAYTKHGVINVPVILAAITAVAALLTRQVVTPIADPVDGAGRPLVPAPGSVNPESALETGDVTILPAAVTDVPLPPTPWGGPHSGSP
jgi:hypothetical protein